MRLRLRSDGYVSPLFECISHTLTNAILKQGSEEREPVRVPGVTQRTNCVERNSSCYGRAESDGLDSWSPSFFISVPNSVQSPARIAASARL